MLKQIIYITAIASVASSALPSLTISEIILHASTLVAQKQTTTQTVTLSVPGMTCRVCQITIKKALESVKGVNQVSVNFDAKTVAMTFNPNKTSVSDLVEATKKSGYPSSIKK